MVRFHKSVGGCLQEASTWAGIGGPIGVLGSQIDKPWSTACFVGAAVCGVLAVVLREPNNKDKENQP